MAEDQGSSSMANREFLNSVPNSDASSHNLFGFLTSHGMLQLHESHQPYHMIKNMFLQLMDLLASQTTVVAIHQNNHSSWSGNIRYQSHQILLGVVASKCGGNANYTWGWYGASKDDISAIVSHGFTRPDEPAYGRSYGVGIHLSAPNYLLHEIIHSPPDEEGTRHIFTCLAIMGKTEVISYRSAQFKPSSLEFDTGVDDPVAPKVYIVWSAYMNSYLTPDLVISFKSPLSQNNSIGQLNSMPPMRPAISFSNLIAILERLLEPSRFRLISEQYDLFKKIAISPMIHVMRRIAGDELLDTLVKYNKNM
ncbi:probable inactive poly [ADP-ribose] polymerase SRO2 isoform X2 [Tripterygium wilfordii]|uniref:probable inactive poly [ADP-ribose] polymerase SRO2 isoform X2 n=1 Tax=Tripterygium wilfordii TaxID=458696 RepID=UPI0018F84270|nr:probable inactive poly [ADP-ribose] polymerase SRO2 isoform X2 [Tripterygium wilfordii]